jgi:hypothetical protein
VKFRNEAGVILFKVTNEVTVSVNVNAIGLVPQIQTDGEASSTWTSNFDSNESSIALVNYQLTVCKRGGGKWAGKEESCPEEKEVNCLN